MDIHGGKSVRSRLSLRGVALAAAFAFTGIGAIRADGALPPEEVFRNPPQSAKTGVWWHWMGSNVTKEGIVKDLDWFAAVGIGSATIFGMADICVPWATGIANCPTGKLIAFTPEWWAMVKFACDEAEKRGVELGVHNCPGYTSTGGPWIEPRLSMRELVFNVTNVKSQISLVAHCPNTIEVAPGVFGKAEVPSRHTDFHEIGVVDGVRVAHIPMGSYTQPNQAENFGLECDKMNPEAVAFHMDHVIGEMKRHLGRHVGRTVRFVLLDSYEAGRPTWTPRMREEFKERRGYDPLPFLPVLGGYKVSAAPDKAAEQKFRNDFDRTVKDLYRDVLYRIMHEKLNAAGLEFACEPYRGPFDSRECARHVDRLMMEFHYSARMNRRIPRKIDWNEWIGPNGKRHNIVEAEAFTGGPPGCQWQETPRILKAMSDTQFSRGINRMILHTCPLQPWGDEVKPGKVMGRWGTHFGRNQTWALSGKGFFDYLNRCQALLQWGEVSDKRVQFRDISPKQAPITATVRESDGRIVVFVVNHSDSVVDFEMTVPLKSSFSRWFDPVRGSIESSPMSNGTAQLSLPPCGSGFLEVIRHGEGAGTEHLEKSGKGVLSVVATLPEKFEVRFGEHKTEISGLRDWTSSEDPRIRYFSGTALYRTGFDLGGCDAGKGTFVLSLGDCNGQIAKVALNGCDIGTVWCDPYEVEIPEGLLKCTGNSMEIEFTNVWANRLIGDEQEPPDCNFVKAPYPGGWYMTRFPDWFKDGIPSRPSKGRKCFTDWNYFTADSPLVPSGLLGPVQLKRRACVATGGKMEKSEN